MGGTRRGVQGTRQVTMHKSQGVPTLRQESRGRKHTNVGSSFKNPISRVRHLQNLAAWVTSNASLQSLGAFFGQQLVAVEEASGVRPDPSLFPCERCGSILQPGGNCTVRIDKSNAMARRQKNKRNTSVQNNVLYSCHFCSHRNLRRGTSKGYMKEICPSKSNPLSKLEIARPLTQESGNVVNSIGCRVEVVYDKGSAVTAKRSGEDEISQENVFVEKARVEADGINFEESAVLARGGGRDKIAKDFGRMDKDVRSCVEVNQMDLINSASQTSPSFDERLKSCDKVKRMGDVIVPGICIDSPRSDNLTEAEKKNETSSLAVVGDIPMAASHETPLINNGFTILEKKRRKRKKSGSKKTAESESAGSMIDAEKSISSSRRRKRSKWTTLKEIAESTEREKNQKLGASIAIPFAL